MKKLLIITYYWPPSGGPGVQRWLKFSTYLAQMGYEPFVVTVNPDEATYPVADQTLAHQVSEKVKVFHTSTREPYSLYKKISRRKQVPYSGFTNEQKSSFFSTLSRFIRGNLFVPDARVGWNKFALNQARQLINEQEISTIITTSPPHSTQLVGLQLKKEFPHINWIADLRDPWTDIFYYNKMLHLPFVKSHDLALEKRVLQSADSVITVSDYIKEKLASKISVHAISKFQVITNGFDPEDFKDLQPEVIKPHHTIFTIGYIGTLADDYDLSGFIAAVNQWHNQSQQPFSIKFTGSLSGKWKEQLNQKLGNYIETQGHTTHREALLHMQEADLLLLVIPDIEQNRGIVTGKIFEYMASGKQILGIGPTDGDAARILKQTGSGKMFHYQDTDGIARFINQVANPNQTWQANFEAINEFSRKTLTEHLIRLF
jgi:glycosyltransferase involved in cell wall biosynthesis